MTLSWRRSLSYRNQYIDLHSNYLTIFYYNRGWLINIFKVIFLFLQKKWHSIIRWNLDDNFLKYHFFIILSVIRQKGGFKTGVSRKQSTPNFPKNQDFLPPDMYTYVCVSGGKKCSFFGNLGVLCFFETPVLRFAHLPIYRQFVILKVTRLVNVIFLYWMSLDKWSTSVTVWMLDWTKILF